MKKNKKKNLKHSYAIFLNYIIPSFKIFSHLKNNIFQF